MKNSNFYRGTTYPKFELLVQLWPQYTPWRWWKSKITIRLSKSIKMEALSPLNFHWKSWLRFSQFRLFWIQMGPGSKIQWASTKNYCHAYRILSVKGVGRLSESVKKGKFMTKIFFQIMLNEVLKICKNWYLLM